MWSRSSAATYQYTLPGTYAPRRPAATFSRTEIQHIVIALTVLTFDFWLLFSGLTGFSMFAHVAGMNYVQALAVALLVGLTGFFSHEMAHKFAARAFGLWAEFRMYVQMLFLSIIMAAIGFLYAAPGATVVSGAPSLKREWGLISIAGPGMNLVWTGAFLGAALLPFHYHGYLFWTAVFALVAQVNTWFAIFNLIPWGPLDGRKIWHWSKPVWVGAFAGAVALFIFLFIL